MADVTFTLAEAAEALTVIGPPLSEGQLRGIVTALALTPAGTRRRGPGHPGRPERTFDAAALMRIHAALQPWLGST
jgi:hypothetical protein